MIDLELQGEKVTKSYNSSLCANGIQACSNKGVNSQSAGSQSQSFISSKSKEHVLLVLKSHSSL